MGQVWAADHLSLRTQVAVKLLDERSASVPEAIARFSAEAAAAARIHSPHVVQVFDHGVADGAPYIVMELLDGEDLGQRLARDGPLPLAEAAEVIVQVCKALEKAHALGVVHRDIKPSNVFLVSGLDGIFVKVLDFGLAKYDDEGLGQLTDSHKVFGTPHYLSPEQAQSARDATAQSDLWSVAVVAYECLTRTRPFDATSLMGLCLALNTGRFAPPSSVRADLPAALDAWFTRAFQRAPSMRFASARELAATFANALRGEAHATPEERTASAMVRSSPVDARRPARIRILGVTALGALAMLAVLAGSGRLGQLRSPASAQTAAPPGPVPTPSPQELAVPVLAVAPPTASAASLAESPATDASRPRPTSPGRHPQALPLPAPSTGPVVVSDEDLFNDPKPRR